jgi:hypothetical protein
VVSELTGPRCCAKYPVLSVPTVIAAIVGGPRASPEARGLGCLLPAAGPYIKLRVDWVSIDSGRLAVAQG